VNARPVQYAPPRCWSQSAIDEGASAACGFPVLVAVSGVLTIQVLYDAGNPIRAQVHGNIDGTLSANGITLREIERGQTFYDPTDGSQTLVGLIFRVFLPHGGTVIADVGRLVFDAEGNVTSEAGPPPGASWRLRRPQLSSVVVRCSS
jgi:hypothetical protein